MIKRRPVQIRLPMDMAEVKVSKERLQKPIDLVEANDELVESCVVKAILDKLYAAKKRPIILADGLAWRFQVRRVLSEANLFRVSLEPFLSNNPLDFCLAK